MTKIFVDFDQTLFDSTKMLKVWMEKLDDRRVDPQVALAIYQKASEEREALSFDDFLDAMSKKVEGFPRNKARLTAFGLLSSLKDFVYPDVWKFLDEGREYDLNILTSGERMLQKMRIRASGLGKYFNQVICTEGPKVKYLQSVSKQSEKLILVDDNPLTINAVEEVVPQVVSVWLKRTDNIFSEHDSKYHDFEVEGFKSLGRLLERIH